MIKIKIDERWPWICESECPFSRECANHKTAGLHRSEDGFTPNIQLIDGVKMCDQKETNVTGIRTTPFPFDPESASKATVESKQTFLLTAMGGGHHGSAVATIPKTLEEVKEAAKKAGFEVVSDHATSGKTLLSRDDPDRGEGDHVEETTFINVSEIPDDGRTCEINKPTVTIDTGHGDRDVQALDDLIMWLYQ